MNSRLISFRNLSFKEIIEMQRKYNLDVRFRNTMLKKGMTPVNFDSDSKKQARIVAKNLLVFFRHRDFDVYWRRSSSRRGYHFTIFYLGKQLYVTAQISISIREQLGDCFGRLKADRQRIENGLPIGILFDEKNLKESTAWRKLLTVKNIG